MRLRPALLTCAALSSLPALSMVALAPAAWASPTESKPAATPADLAAGRAAVQRLIAQVDIPYQQFTLPNGLRVLVHTDRTMPSVLVSMWYDVGSKHEPAGRSGFAHLFEHLMFNGSENVPGDYMAPLLSVGAQVNGSTSADRTNYYQIVPTPALERALYMESDRMGHLLGALSQATLDEQRGVVQNEKRRGDDGALSIADYMTRAALYPKSHPYGHSVIGSMNDLNAADLADVRSWFKAHYGPNNALLVLAGDIDVETARRLVTRYFGDIPAGPRNVRPDAAPVLLTKTVRETVTAPVTSPNILRAWPAPGADDKDTLALDAVQEVMGGGQDNVFDEHLVRQQKLFQNIRIANITSAQAGEFTISGQVSPGVDAKVAAAALDREIALFLSGTPTDEALTRWVARYTNNFVRQLESPSSRGSTLGEHAMATGDPDSYKTNLRAYAALTPASIMEVARRWLGRPRYELTVVPGPRVTPAEDAGMDGTAAQPASAVSPTPALAPSASSASGAPIAGTRGPLPAVASSPDPRFPAIERARLANGIPVTYARSAGTLFTNVALSIDGGLSAVPADQADTVQIMYSMLDKGFAGFDERRINTRRELLGFSLYAGISGDEAGLGLDAPNGSLEPGLDMMSTMLTRPTFPTDVIDRLKRQWLQRLAAVRLSPGTLSQQELLPLLDAGSPYNRTAMYDDPASIRRIDRPALVAAFHRWVRPEHAALTVVSDRPLAELLPMLNRTVGAWRAEGKVVPVPKVAYRPQPGAAQVVLIDLPGAVQATINGGQWVALDDKGPTESLDLANDVLGGGFTSRLNTNLREDKHWSYGAGGSFVRKPYGSSYRFSTTVQQDKAGPAIAEVMKEVKGIVGDKPITDAEFKRSQQGGLGQAASAYSNRYAIQNALDDIRNHNRPDSYPAELGARVRALTPAIVNAALREQLTPGKWVWVVVGNAAIIRPQLDALGLPVRVVKAADVLPPL